jgi:hypothetical protein
VEDQVSYPLTVNLQGLADVRVIRSQSAFSFDDLRRLDDNIGSVRASASWSA